MDASKVRVQLSPHENIAVGAFGGALETCMLMPVLTFKFCTQEGRKLPQNFGGWYRGVGVQAGTVAPITALQMMVNGFFQSLALRGEKRNLTAWEQIYTAAAAGATSAVVYTPVDLTTIQQQKLNLNPTSTLAHIMKEYGLQGVFRGFMSCAAREAIYTAGYLGAAPVISDALAKMDIFRERQFAAGLCGACIAGTAAAWVTHPVDTAKTCMQSDMAGTTYTTARCAMSRLVAEGGLRALFRGGAARTTRVCGAFFVCMSIRNLAIDFKTTRE
eukprot:TRINITY_DN20981_c0_g3_i1.p1 TRINITY_DN20981_c0_g3~~TRINITY_DN20981_c0_g3_i1.p1  ORF type:complete len:273 (-),score=33.70 TRINITY_DN20981_c0_g3_i1:158-976(-)